MILCSCNPRLLSYDWAVELAQRQSGRAGNSGETALILLFRWKPEKTNFGSKGFKLLWEKEKDISVDKLKEMMHKKPELKERVVAAVPGAAAYYK